MGVSKPEVQANVGIFILTYGPEELVIRVDRVRENSKYELSGEMRVVTTAPGVDPLLHQARINLTNTRSRTEAAKRLASRLDTHDWDAIINLTCIVVLEKYREGEPDVALSEIPLPESIPYRLHPILFDKEANLFHGEGGIGKSLLAAYCTVLVEEGYAAHELMPEPGNSLYMDYETSPVTARRRFHGLYGGLDLENLPTTRYRYCFQPLASEIQEIQRIVFERNIQFIIIDSAGPACGGEPEKASSAIEYFAALRSLKITSLTIAHKAKDSKGPWPFGSIYWWNYPRNIFELKKVQDPEDAFINVGLFHRKINDGRLMKPLGFRFDFRDGQISVTRPQMRDIPEFADSMPISDQIVAMLHGGAQHVRDIATDIGETANAVSAAFKRNTGNRFVKLPDGRWGLTDTIHSVLPF